MTNLVPSEPRIDQAALERILQRATELQSRDREVGEELSETELMQLGEEVGILPQHLRRALSEERSRALVAADRNPLGRLMGPGKVAAQRTVNGTVDNTEAALKEWMSEGELLQIKRRYPDRTSWERKEGAFASLKRSFGAGGRKYVLAGAAEVISKVAAAGESQTHVQLLADISNKRTGHVIGSSVLIGSGASVTGILLLLGVMVPAAVVPAIVCIPIAATVARSHLKEVEKFQVALEQILDRLEHGEIGLKPKQIGPGEGGIGRIADEIRKNLGI